MTIGIRERDSTLRVALAVEWFPTSKGIVDGAGINVFKIDDRGSSKASNRSSEIHGIRKDVHAFPRLAPLFAMARARQCDGRRY
jgi:hypothetical protein